jgi:hypothetical protein
MPVPQQRREEEERQREHNVGNLTQHGGIAEHNERHAEPCAHRLQGAELPHDENLYADPADEQRTRVGRGVTEPWVATPRERGDCRRRKADDGDEREPSEDRAVKRQCLRYRGVRPHQTADHPDRSAERRQRNQTR